MGRREKSVPLSLRRGRTKNITSGRPVRAVFVIHATRRYEYAPCVIGKRLATPEDVLSCFMNAGAVNSDLERRPTSEGRFFCGERSKPLALIARSNVMDTFPGGIYEDSLKRTAARLHAEALRIGDRPEDAPALDFCWEEIRWWSGFGGKDNAPGGSVRGFVAKNIVFQGLRNVLHELGFARGRPETFVSGPNPCKLASVYWQCRSPAREQQQCCSARRATPR